MVILGTHLLVENTIIRNSKHVILGLCHSYVQVLNTWPCLKIVIMCSSKRIIMSLIRNLA